MKYSSMKMVSGALAVWLGSALAIACGDDEIPEDQGQGGGGASSDSDSDDGSSTGGSGPTTGGQGNLGGEGGGPDVGVSTVVPVATRIVPNSVNPYALAFDSQDRLYVAGTTDVAAVTAAQDLRLAVWRYSAAGVLDTTFGENGVAIADATLNPDSATITNPGTAYDIIELSDGAFAILTSGTPGVSITKLTADGDFEPSVEVHGAWTPTVREQLDELADTALTECTADSSSSLCTDAVSAAQAIWPAVAGPGYAQRPGKPSSWGMARSTHGGTESLVVFLAGPAAPGSGRTDNDRHITRLLAADLTVDDGFATDGVYSTDPNGAGISNGARRGIVLEDGSIVSTGYSDYAPNGNHIELIKLLPSGAPDESFSYSGSARGEGLRPAVPGLAFINPFATGQAEAYSVRPLSTGTLITTGYGSSNFDTTTIENDLISTAVTEDGLDPTYGGNKQDALFGVFAVQSELDPNAGSGARPYRENGRDLVVLSDDRTVHVGCYDDGAALFVITPEGQLDSAVGNGSGRIQYSYPSPFFKAALSHGGKFVAATATSRAKVTTGNSPAYSAALLAIVEVTDAE